MWPDPQKTGDLVTFSKEILNGKLYFLCSKSYGISIYGVIDGYSRCIIWLLVEAANHIPELIAKYYFHAVKQMKGKPKAAWANDGTEHSVIKPLHVYFSEVIFFQRNCQNWQEYRGDKNRINSKIYFLITLPF